MKNNIKYLIYLLLGVSLVSCKKYLEPEADNRLTEEQLIKNPAYAEGLLLNAYLDMPAVTSFDMDVIADDAVTNNPNSEYRLMATGNWTSTNSPVSIWSRAYKEIFYVNSFLALKDKIVWDDKNEAVNDLHSKRLTGEAFGLRAWWQFQLLKIHAGETSEGQLLGFPIITTVLTTTDNLNLPRNTFDECVTQILSDCDRAIENLPDRYADVSGNADYNQALGKRWSNRMTGYAARALKSAVTLYAASPAYNAGSIAERWENAARAAGELLKLNGGVPALSASGLTWYTNSADPDVIWARAMALSRGLEVGNFPPSLLGNGLTNPSQELVNAFPVKRGYPIDHPSSLYNASDPYANRDPRLAAYILYNGNALGAKGTIYTYIGAPQNGINAQTNSTRTGYYLKKFMLDNVNLATPAVSQNHFHTYFRFTEVFLNYAEAANEAYGPNGDPNGYGFTARSVVAAIRKRAGITQPDAYLASLVSKEDFRILVRNERRLELCFEGQRFNDLRRWEDLNRFKAPVMGAFITMVGTTPSYAYQHVEDRNYQDYMIYGPIPNGEVLKSNQLKQNKGW